MEHRHIKFGDIITLKLAKDELYFSCPGFVNTEVMLKKIKKLDKDDISECLFRIIPPISFPVQKKCKSIIPENDKSTVLDEMADEIQEH